MCACAGVGLTIASLPHAILRNGGSYCVSVCIMSYNAQSRLILNIKSQGRISIIDCLGKTKCLHSN